MTEPWKGREYPVTKPDTQKQPSDQQRWEQYLKWLQNPRIQNWRRGNRQ